MRDYERRVFEAAVASSAKATATTRIGWRQQLQVADVDEDVAVDAGVVAKDAFGSDELGQRTLDMLSSSLTAQALKSYAGRLSQFAEFCHDSENISPLEATTATVVRYDAWIGDRGHIGAKSLQPYMSAINTFFELHNLDPIAKDSLHLTSASLRKGAASAANAIGVPLSHIRYQGGWATNSDIVLDYIAPLRHFQVQQDSAALAVPVPPS
eukprot:jgi/Tetstr1/445444/TSEL_033223.t1